jgi:hypothetical protein
MDSMPTRLIELPDGMLVEVEVEPDEAQSISGGSAKRVSAGFDKVQPMLLGMCESLAETCREIQKTTGVQSAELELGLSFEAEGNLYITKSTASANLTVRLVLLPQTE